MTIKSQILITFGVILSALIYISYLGLESIITLQVAYERSVEPSSQVMLAGARMNQELLEHSLSNIKLLSAKNADQAEYLRESKKAKQSIRHYYEILQLRVDQKGEDLLNQFKSAWDSYNDKTKILQDSVLNNIIDNPRAIIVEANKDLEVSQRTIRALVDKNESDATKIAAFFKQEYQQAKSYHASISAILIVMAILSLFFISRRLDNSIKFIHDYARRLAGGDYSQKFAIKGSDEIAEIVDCLNNISTSQGIMIDNLKQQLERIYIELGSVSSTEESTCQKIITLQDDIKEIINQFDNQV